MESTKFNAVHPLSGVTAFDYTNHAVKAICFRANHQPGDCVAVFTDTEAFALYPSEHDSDSDASDKTDLDLEIDYFEEVLEQPWIEQRRKDGRISKFDLDAHVGRPGAEKLALELMGVASAA